MIALTLGLTPALFSQVEFIEVVTPADMDEAREKVDTILATHQSLPLEPEIEKELGQIYLRAKMVANA